MRDDSMSASRLIAAAGQPDVRRDARLSGLLRTEPLERGSVHQLRHVFSLARPEFPTESSDWFEGDAAVRSKLGVPNPCAAR